jgi:hypothetical protein
MTDTFSNNDSLELLAGALKTARLKKNLSVEEVSQLTKIKKHYLEQLENGNFSFLPNSYVYACTKAYIKEMGLDGSEVLEICKKDLQIQGALNKEEILETGSVHNEKRSRGNTSAIKKNKCPKALEPSSVQVSYLHRSNPRFSTLSLRLCMFHVAENKATILRLLPSFVHRNHDETL